MRRCTQADSRKTHVTHLRHSQQIIAIFLPAEYVMIVLQRLKPLEERHQDHCDEKTRAPERGMVIAGHPH